MSLIVGNDSFVSVEDADKYVNETYTDTNAYRKKWSALTTENKEILLRRSTKALNRLKYVGRTKRHNQKLAFPRVMNYGVGGVVYAPWVSQYHDNQLISNGGPSGDPDGMIAIAEATIENALGIAFYDNVQTDVNELNIRGLIRTSEKIGSSSETYSSNGSGTNKITSDIFNNKIYSILNYWLISAHVSL